MEEVVGSHAAVQLDPRATTAVAFVEGGIQDPCDDACSICLEHFHESDPSTVTTCEHEFHLQCILEWCQRSSNCPMCWQEMSLKDAASQELLNGVERERSLRSKVTKNVRTFHHPVLGEIKLPDLSPDATEADIQEQILHHLAVTIGGRRRTLLSQGHNRSSSVGSHGLVVSSTTAAHPGNSVSSPAANQSEPTRFQAAAQSSAGPQDSTNSDEGDTAAQSSHHHHHHHRRHHHHHHHHHENSSDESSAGDHKRAPSSLTFSYSLKKISESVWKSTQSFKEKLFGRSHSMSETVRKDGNSAGSVSHNASSHSEQQHTSNHVRSYSMFHRKTPEI